MCIFVGPCVFWDLELPNSIVFSSLKQSTLPLQLALKTPLPAGCSASRSEMPIWCCVIEKESVKRSASLSAHTLLRVMYLKTTAVSFATLWTSHQRMTKWWAPSVEIWSVEKSCSHQTWTIVYLKFKKKKVCEKPVYPLLLNIKWFQNKLFCDAALRNWIFVYGQWPVLI